MLYVLSLILEENSTFFLIFYKEGVGGYGICGHTAKVSVLLGITTATGLQGREQSYVRRATTKNRSIRTKPSAAELFPGDSISSQRTGQAPCGFVALSNCRLATAGFSRLVTLTFLYVIYSKTCLFFLFFLSRIHLETFCNFLWDGLSYSTFTPLFQDSFSFLLPNFKFFSFLSFTGLLC